MNFKMQSGDENVPALHFEVKNLQIKLDRLLSTSARSCVLEHELSSQCIQL